MVIQWTIAAFFDSTKADGGEEEKRGAEVEKTGENEDLKPGMRMGIPSTKQVSRSVERRRDRRLPRSGRAGRIKK